MKKYAIYIIGVAAISSCVYIGSNTSSIDKAYEAGGATTIFGATSHAYSLPAPNLSKEQLEKHLEGDISFEATFVTAPSDINPGLGPLFNNNSCISCHVKDGRALPPEGNEPTGFLVRLSVPGKDKYGGPKPVPGFGGQLQTRSNLRYSKGSRCHY